MAAREFRRTTLRQQVLANHRGDAGSAAEFAELLDEIGTMAETLARTIRRAALSGELGLAGGTNVTGDAQKKLDVLANGLVVQAFEETGRVAAIVSEEMEGARILEGREDGEYVLCVDPVDGSSNTDVNGALGTIFGLYRRPAGGPIEAKRDLLRPGSEQALAGYVMYGPSTVLVYTAGRGTFGFTLDEESGEFILTLDALVCPPRGHTYSANLGNITKWDPGVREYVDGLTRVDPAARRPYSLRYTGALVADLHRSLVEGGLYFYPADSDRASGKLRLLYECAPLALVVEQAGGRASTGTERILDVRPESLHQRVPLVIGSAEDVAEYERFWRNGGARESAAGTKEGSEP